MTSDSLSDVEKFLLLQIAEAHEDLQQLIFYVSYYFPEPHRPIYKLYQLVYETLEALRSRGLAKLIKVTYIHVALNTFEILSQEDVLEEDVLRIINDPRCWNRSAVFDDGSRYFYDTTEAGERYLGLL